MDSLYSVMEKIITAEPIIFNGFDCQPVIIGLACLFVVCITVYSVFRIVGMMFK